ncbi:hypothetical protein [Chitinophaga sancti]|uniref:DUF3592 domain-containing protein n=1 Tax=Chitinophaga sancti TaxID=1004 RepID=A0ABZ0XM51_9BACT|nr:hypothetical protein [Chitinophaga sancti]WQG91763.1 hypothetical protein SR876_09620 [Chitinophaga sancti]
MKKSHGTRIQQSGRKYRIKMGIWEFLFLVGLLITNYYYFREYQRSMEATWVKVHVDDRKITMGKRNTVYYFLVVNYKGLVLNAPVNVKRYESTPLNTDINAKFLPATNEVWFSDNDVLLKWRFWIIALGLLLLVVFGMPLINR